MARFDGALTVEVRLDLWRSAYDPATDTARIFAPGLPKPVSEWTGPAAYKLAAIVVARLNAGLAPPAKEAA